MLPDPVIGKPLPTASFVVDGPSMKVFSLIMRDPNPIHYDPSFVRSMGLGDRPVNQGTINMAYPLDVLLGLVQAPGQVRRFRCRFQGSLFAGDRVVVSGEVSAVDDDSLTIDMRLDRADGERVLTATAVVSRSP